MSPVLVLGAGCVLAAALLAWSLERHRRQLRDLHIRLEALERWRLWHQSGHAKW